MRYITYNSPTIVPIIIIIVPLLLPLTNVDVQSETKFTRVKKSGQIRGHYRGENSQTRPN